jgi:hypothetical protein
VTYRVALSYTELVSYNILICFYITSGHNFSTTTAMTILQKQILSHRPSSHILVMHSDNINICRTVREFEFWAHALVHCRINAGSLLLSAAKIYAEIRWTNPVVVLMDYHGNSDSLISTGLSLTMISIYRRKYFKRERAYIYYPN